MLALFKGELSYHDITYGIPYKKALELREARIRRLIKEKEGTDKAARDAHMSDIRNSILAR